jgi:hypothetical protein
MDLAVQTTAAIKRSREEDDIDNEEIMNDSKRNKANEDNDPLQNEHDEEEEKELPDLNIIPQAVAFLSNYTPERRNSLHFKFILDAYVYPAVVTILRTRFPTEQITIDLESTLANGSNPQKTDFLMDGLRFIKGFSRLMGLQDLPSDAIFEDCVRSRNIGCCHEKLPELRTDMLFLDGIERAILILYILREDEMAKRAHESASTLFPHLKIKDYGLIKADLSIQLANLPDCQLF